jgi:prepilin-type N-terminal cleavage/methylation domain-containing protein
MKNVSIGLLSRTQARDRGRPPFARRCSAPFRLPPSSSGFSLLEVIIALGIMAGAMVILGELARAGLRHAEAARDLAEAEIVCESKLAEITSGLTQPESVGATGADSSLGDSGMTTASSDQGKWMYAVDVTPVDGQEGLLAVKVTVSLAQDQQGSAQDKQGAGGKTSVTLTRWMVDPNSTSSSSTTNSGSSDSSSSQNPTPSS